MRNYEALSKDLCRYGSVRINDEVFIREANVHNLKDFEVWRTTVDDKEYYMAARDPMTRVYASWLYNVVLGRNMR